MDGATEARRSRYQSRSQKIVRSVQKRPIPDVDKIVKKTIDEVTEKRYNRNRGKSDRIEGLGKEVKNGAL